MNNELSPAAPIFARAQVNTSETEGVDAAISRALDVDNNITNPTEFYGVCSPHSPLSMIQQQQQQQVSIPFPSYLDQADSSSSLTTLAAASTNDNHFQMASKYEVSKNISRLGKACEIIDPGTGKILKVFYSVSQAEKETGEKRMLIGKACHKGGGLVGPYYFRFVRNFKVSGGMRMTSPHLFPIVQHRQNQQQKCSNPLLLPSKRKYPLIAPMPKTLNSQKATDSAIIKPNFDEKINVKVRKSHITTTNKIVEEPKYDSHQNSETSLSNVSTRLLLVSSITSPSREKPSLIRTVKDKDDFRYVNNLELCIICQKNKAKIILIPCQHCLMCRECYFNHFARKFCPVCRTSITSFSLNSLSEQSRPRIYSAYSFME